MAAASSSQGVASQEELYAVTVLFELESGAFGAFHRMVSENAEESVRKEAGCLRFDVLVPAGREEAIFLYEIYSNRAAFDHHLGTPHFQHFDAATRSLVRHKTVSFFSVRANVKPEAA